MNPKVIEISQRRYLTITQLEQGTEGETCYVAKHPEILGCMSQGATPEEAEANLVEVTQMIIEHMLEHNLPVPDPWTFPGRHRRVETVDLEISAEHKLEAPGFSFAGFPIAVNA